MPLYRDRHTDELVISDDMVYSIFRNCYRVHGSDSQYTKVENPLDINIFIEYCKQEGLSVKDSKVAWEYMEHFLDD